MDNSPGLVWEDTKRRHPLPGGPAGSGKLKTTKEGGTMDDELKRYLDAMEARITGAIDRLRVELASEVEVHVGEKRVDPVARKLEGSERAEP